MRDSADHVSRRAVVIGGSAGAASLAVSTGTAQAAVSDRLVTGTSLVPGQQLMSANKTYRLILQTNGDLILTQGTTVTWRTNTAGKGGVRLSMLANGYLLLATKSWATVWLASARAVPGPWLQVRNDGVLAIYDNTNRLVWTNVAGYVHDKLSNGASLIAGQSMVSRYYGYRLLLRADGNVVILNLKGAVTWQSGTANSGGTRLTVGTNGNLTLSTTKGAVVWQTQSVGVTAPSLVLSTSGVATLTDSAGRTVWSSALGYVHDKLGSGGALKTSQSMVARGGAFTLTLGTDGNLVESAASGAAVWSTGTTGSGATSLTMRSDGNVVLYTPNWKTPWSTATAGVPTPSLQVRSTGAVVLADGSGRTAWSTTGGYVYDVLTSGQSLTVGSLLISRYGGYRLSLTTTGILQIVNLSGTVTWSTSTSGSGATTLTMRTGGALTLSTASGAVVWSTGTKGTGLRARLLDDGNLVVTTADGKTVVWSARPPAAGVGPIGDDYPVNLKSAAKDSARDPWGYHNRECTSFTAWRLSSQNRIQFINCSYAGQVWGYAMDWGNAARAAGITVDNRPARGCVAWYTSGPGHVAWVCSVSGNQVQVEDYNWVSGAYGTRWVDVSKIAGFIHL